MNLILVYGPPAAGKLTVATEVSKLKKYVLFDNHKATDYISEIFPRSNPAFDQVRSDIGKKIRIDVFAAASKAGVNLIATYAPLATGMDDFINQTITAVEHANGSVLLVHLLPSREVLLKRVIDESRRGKKIDTTERWREVVDGGKESLRTFEGREHCVIDNSHLSPTEVAEKIIKHYNL